MKKKIYLLQKETQLFMRVYALAVSVRAILFAFFTDVVYKDVYPNGFVKQADEISGVTIGIFLAALAIMSFSASFTKEADLRRNTLALIFIELLTFAAPLKVLSEGLSYPHMLSVFHAVQLLILIYLYQGQLKKTY